MAKLSKHKQKVLERQARAAERRVTLPDHFEKVPIISWYPGHMLKAQREMREKIKLVDVVIELVDSRIAYTSVNSQFTPLFENRPRLIVLNKALLADKEETTRWLEYYRAKGLNIMAIDAFRKFNVDKVLPAIRKIVGSSTKKFRTGIRCMIIGIPNVGKSTFINMMAGKRIAVAGPKPGLTRHQQWVSLASDVELLDTPGVMYPRIETKADELNLALTAGIKDELVGEQLVAEYLIYRLRQRDSLSNIKHLKIDEEVDVSSLSEEQILKIYARCRGFLGQDGVEDLHKASTTLLHLFREGDLGRFSLNWVSELDEEVQEKTQEGEDA
ncbi:MAG: ribosome biogenesis GTPase YlqF [Lentisphaeria bacterium]